MTQEIYFDGNLMDTDESTKITLSIKNNLFTEIKKCVGNRTYTVQFPKTAHNQKVIGYAHLPASDSTIPYSYHTARYVRNGIEIFSDGYAYIISVKEKIEVCMVWGIPANIRAVFSDELKLNEMADDGKKTANFSRYPSVTTWANLVSARENNGWCWAAIDFQDYVGLKLFNYYDTQDCIDRMPKMGWLRPSVFVRHILNRLMNEYKIAFMLDDQSIISWVDSMLLPCVTDNCREAVTPQLIRRFNSTYWENTQVNEMVFDDEVGRMVRVANCHPKYEMDVRVAFIATFYQTCNENTLRHLLSTGRMFVRVYTSDESFDEDIPVLPAIFNSNNQPWNPNSGTNITDTWKIVYNQSVDLHTNGSAVGIRFFFDATEIFDFTDGDTVQFYPTVTEVIYGVPYPMTPNYPDVKITEFLEWMAAATGTFPVQNRDETRDLSLVFVPVKRIFDNKANAVDWSSKLVRAYNDGAAREIGFIPDNWAQVNNYAYKDEKNNGDFADGKIVINNVQLEREQDVVGDIFAACNPPNNVPVYKTNDSDDGADLLWHLFPTWDADDYELEKQTATPRIMLAKKLTVNGTDYIQGVFDTSLYWSSILKDERYQQFKNSLQKTKILNEVFALTELDIKQFDETIPVYLAQYGHYYAVLEIKTSETGVSEVTLFQLEL